MLNLGSDPHCSCKVTCQCQGKCPCKVTGVFCDDHCKCGSHSKSCKNKE